jgi:serine/threonine protein kinase
LGYAKELGQSSLALSFVGTLQYIAPELFLSEEYTKSVDYWSLGFIAHECATGHRPFLPTFNPGQWIDHVQSKSRRDICIYQTEPDKMVKNSEKFFPENFLTNSISEDLEGWLMSLLEWDPGRRGKNDAGEVCVFSDLGCVLSKTRLKLVSMDRATQKVEYVIEESTTVKHLSAWVERDTGVKMASQMLLLAGSGKQLETSDALFPLVQQLREEEKTIYVFDGQPPSGSIKEQYRALALNIPSSVAPFLQHPRMEVTYPHKKIIYAHGFYFFATEQSICRQFSQGVRVFILHLLNKIKDLNMVSQEIAKSFERAAAKFDFFKESLFHDLEKYSDQSKKRDRITSLSIFESWKRSAAEMERQVSIIRDELSTAESGMKKVNAEALEIQRIPKQARADDLQLFRDKSIGMIENMKRIPVEGKKEKERVTDLAHLVVKCLRQRDIFLQEHFGQRSRLRQAHFEVQSLAPLQGMLRHNLVVFSNAVSKLQRKRQSDIWKLLAAAVQQKTSSPSCRRSPSSPSVSAQASPMQSPLVGVQESALLFDATTIATRNAMEENNAQRATLQEFVNRNRLDDFD